MEESELIPATAMAESISWGSRLVNWESRLDENTKPAVAPTYYNLTLGRKLGTKKVVSKNINHYK